jgi:hypothetical protein
VEEQPTLAQIAYDAYGSMLRMYDGEPLLAPWEMLPPQQRAAWQYAIDKVEESLADLYARRTHT